MKTIGTIEIALGKLHQILINQITTWQLINWVSRIKFQLKIHFNKKIINKQMFSNKNQKKLEILRYKNQKVKSKLIYFLHKMRFIPLLWIFIDQKLMLIMNVLIMASICILRSLTDIATIQIKEEEISLLIKRFRVSLGELWELL